MLDPWGGEQIIRHFGRPPDQIPRSAHTRPARVRNGRCSTRHARAPELFISRPTRPQQRGPTRQASGHLCHNREVKDNILVRAIITGFGLRIGSEIGKFVAARVFPKEENKADGGEDDKNDESDEDDGLGSVTPDPPDL